MTGTTVQLPRELETLVNSRLDTIDRMLVGRVPRQDRLGIVREVESQIYDLLGEGGHEEHSRDSVLAVLARLDPPEAYLPDQTTGEPASERLFSLPADASRAAAGTTESTRRSRQRSSRSGRGLSRFAQPISLSTRIGSSKRACDVVWLGGRDFLPSRCGDSGNRAGVLRSVQRRGSDGRRRGGCFVDPHGTRCGRDLDRAHTCECIGASRASEFAVVACEARPGASRPNLSALEWEWTAQPKAGADPERGLIPSFRRAAISPFRALSRATLNEQDLCEYLGQSLEEIECG